MPVLREEDHGQISDVLVRYATGIDQRNWTLFRTCWMRDAEADYGPFGRFTGVDAVTEAMASAHEGMGPTFHRMSNFVINVVGDRADVRSYVHTVLMVTPNSPDRWIDVVGGYEDTFARTDEGWRISRRVARMARTITHGVIPGAAPPAPRKRADHEPSPP